MPSKTLSGASAPGFATSVRNTLQQLQGAVATWGYYYVIDPPMLRPRPRRSTGVARGIDRVWGMGGQILDGRPFPRTAVAARNLVARVLKSRPIGVGGARTRSVQTVLDRDCPYCLRSFDAFSTTGPFKTYCSARCRRPRVRCQAHSGSTTRTVTCRCGVVFETWKPNRLSCSAACNLARQNERRPDGPGRGRGRRFPRVRGRQRRAIFERDGWICQICHAPIDRARRFPDPGFATIDHRDAFGAHEPSNWQSAHLVCNVSKGTKLAPGASPKLRRIAA